MEKTVVRCCFCRFWCWDGSRQARVTCDQCTHSDARCQRNAPLASSNKALMMMRPLMLQWWCYCCCHWCWQQTSVNLAVSLLFVVFTRCTLPLSTSVGVSLQLCCGQRDVAASTKIPLWRELNEKIFSNLCWARCLVPTPCDHFAAHGAAALPGSCAPATRCLLRFIMSTS